MRIHTDKITRTDLQELAPLGLQFELLGVDPDENLSK